MDVEPDRRGLVHVYAPGIEPEIVVARGKVEPEFFDHRIAAGEGEHRLVGDVCHDIMDAGRNARRHDHVKLRAVSPSRIGFMDGYAADRDAHVLLQIGAIRP